MILLQQLLSAISAIYATILSTLYTLLAASMARQDARDPAAYTASEKKKTLYPLYRRARHVDKKWAVTCSKPDEFTILGMIPVFGGSMTTVLAIGYLRRIHSTFILPDEIEEQMIHNILIHVGVSLVPMAGWILRRMFGVNKRNYMLLEKYVMSVEPKEETSLASSKTVSQHS